MFGDINNLFKTKKKYSIENVYLKQSVFENSQRKYYESDVVCAVIDYVNDLISGIYDLHEINPNALGAYYADYYYSQVCNGGHSQYLYNSGPRVAEQTKYALMGLKKMGAIDYAKILQAMINWAAKNPEEAKMQDGFDNRAEYLNKLDKALYDLEKRHNIQKLNQIWIETWPELEIIPDADYPNIIENINSQNINREKRLKNAIIKGFTQNLTDSIKVPISLAMYNLPKCIFFTSLLSGAHQEYNGESRLVWNCVGENMDATNKYFAVFTNETLDLCEFIPAENNFSLPNGADSIGPDFIDKLKKFKAPEIGKAFIKLPFSISEKFIIKAKEYNAGLCIDALLHKANINSEGVKLIPAAISDDDMLTICAYGANTQMLNAYVDDLGASLYVFGNNKLIVKLSKSEINEYAYSSDL